MRATSPRGLQTGFARQVLAPDEPGNANIEQCEDQERDREGTGEPVKLIDDGQRNESQRAWELLAPQRVDQKNLDQSMTNQTNAREQRRLYRGCEPVRMSSSYCGAHIIVALAP